jgi:NAD(P)-dependent dehydrogenase (short-subunit alcohol dehydrogenase family)
MKDLAGRIAVITGGGTGMGRELARQLVAEGCHVAMCDVSAEAMAETRRLCAADGLPQGLRVTAHVADVSDEAQVLRFRDEAAAAHATDKIHLLFNNAGIGGGGSLVNGDRAQWEKTFDVCFYGVINGCRAFLPMLMKAREGYIVNTSSVNGFWASLGPGRPHTAYSAAKFGVKGFTEALQEDLKMNAPHIKCAVVMPGHIGTEIVANSRAILSDGKVDVSGARKMMAAMGMDVSKMDDAQIGQMIEMQAIAFRDNAPTSAAQAAKIILDGVRGEKWRILVGDDAHFLDEQVRKDPESAYTAAFYENLTKSTRWGI